jgi:transcription elongation factor GreA
MTNTHYISPEGLQKLKDELEGRKAVLRKEISEKISVAKEQGDLSENFEYSNAKEMQAMNETRIIELEEMMKDAVMIHGSAGGSSITMGARFTVKLPTGAEKEFTVVGSTETDPMAGKISNESPLGKAFLGRSVGESVEMEAGGSKMIYKILSIA